MPEVEELACVLVRYCHCLINFVLQLCDAAYEANQSAYSRCCLMTAAVKPGCLVDGGVPNCCVRERVFEDGGVTRAVAVAT